MTTFIYIYIQIAGMTLRHVTEYCIVAAAYYRAMH